MVFSLDSINYVPTLGIRPGEMRALEELPEKDKARICPAVLMAPWVGSTNLSSSHERLKKAFGERPFILDIDSHYEATDGSRPAVLEFNELKNMADGYQNWRTFVGSLDNAVPAIQIFGADRSSLKIQIDHALGLGRGFCIRICRDRFAEPPADVFKFLGDLGVGGYVVILDAGTEREPISTQQWFELNLAEMLAVNASVPIVLTTAGFPSDFSQFSGIASLPIASRLVFENVFRRFGNSMRLIYGDWATTRPRDYGFARSPVARIDYPTARRWVIAREKDEWDYLEAAKQVVASEHWDNELKIWGSLMIEKTANGDVTGITSPSKNVAARVNIHLHVQTWFNDRIGMLDTDDIWVD